jgi:quercetin dioxygenase-like cupin family protein
MNPRRRITAEKTSAHQTREQRHDGRKTSGIFGRGEENTAYAKYFIGQSYLNVLSREGVVIANVTFEPGCRNNWHVHNADKGGGQILLCTSGRVGNSSGANPPRRCAPATWCTSPPAVKHWHGAAGDSWFSHLAVESARREPEQPMAGARLRRGLPALA